ncbi:MAG: cob(I)yrinic acid a,c-diamide adenosyltransferase [Oceanospirillaceae bacterium]|nr:cob(I)yrinic acid a,c-diamide adenosyltransferase [Oceanospirillaceae bacterium]|tara:strand:- start:1429 stop:2028 length:600 start_codon:yes stop_codon:yes gene_type:complete
MTKETDQQYEQRMKKTKAAVDERVARAQQERGTLIVLTGNGKGKSTSGFGTIFRAAGYGIKAAVVQYIKGTWPCGERDLALTLGIPVEIMGTGFTWETQNRDKDIAAAEKAWAASKAFLEDDSIEVLLLDEITYMLTYEYLDVKEVVAALAARPHNQTVIITGRNCHPDVIALADTVSEINPVKHAFEEGIKARKGVDW